MSMSRASILQDALEIVSKDRNTDYGDPEDNFRDIAELWSVYKGFDFTAHDVAVMMILVKVSRLKTSPDKEDHWIDIAGYAACGGQARAVESAISAQPSGKGGTTPTGTSGVIPFHYRPPTQYSRGSGPDDLGPSID